LDIAMSYIKQKLSQEPFDSQIVEFLKEEGFKSDSWNGEKCMQFVACGKLYCVWIMVYTNRIGYYVEYDCGGKIDSGDREFNGSDFRNFLDVYRNTVDSLAYYTKD
jgi:hypothetical protein